MGVAAAPYGKKLGQMLADDEVAENPDAYFWENDPPKRYIFGVKLWVERNKQNFCFFLIFVVVGEKGEASKQPYASGALCSWIEPVSGMII